jgi:hypothetical protein
MNAYTKKELAEIFSDKELVAKLAGGEFNAEAQAALKEKGIELSEEEIASIQEILMKVKTGKITKEQLEKWTAQLENGELPEETLELVSGGIAGFTIFCIVMIIFDLAAAGTMCAVAAGAFN